MIDSIISMESKVTIYLSSQIGDLALKFEREKLLSVSIADKTSIDDQTTPMYDKPDNQLIESILIQLKRYFTSAILFQSIPMTLQGTIFQKSVWNELLKIPVGETRTYGEIARKLNSSARAVGNACRKNPIQIIIPCHRVVSAKGLGGYAGETGGIQLEIKRWLLNHEGVEL